MPTAQGAGPNGRVFTDMAKLVPAQSANGTINPGALNYENSDLHEIMMRQMREDITAYRHDLDLCQIHLLQPDVTPQEARKLQLRVLDIGHNIRRAQHRLEILAVQKRNGHAPAPIIINSYPEYYHLPMNNNGASVNTSTQMMAAYNGTSSTNSGPNKRKRAPRQSMKSQLSVDSEDEDRSRSISTFTPFNNGIKDEEAALESVTGNSSVQRLGFWRCRLCTSSKYLRSGPERLPSEPCKWPLKDVSKMINHFLSMHVEHTGAERCVELGAALDMNRGPFEYWLRRSHSQTLNDSSEIDICVNTLKAGQVPEMLRKLNKAASHFPEH